MILGKLVAVAATALASIVPTGAFSHSGQTYCPSYQTQYGCTASQHPRQYDVTFERSQVAIAGGHVVLHLNQRAGVSGAFNGEGSVSVLPGQWIRANIWLQCVSGKVANWPAFWLDGSTGSWPRHGEWDVMEGLKRGQVAWHFHYVSAQGQNAQVGNDVQGDYCGWHSYDVERGTSKISFLYDGRIVGVVTAAEIGVPFPADPAYPIFDYGSGVSSGPDLPRAVMVVGKVFRG